ncbi:35505_t:CDS:1, partial [Gigaspora margarita]
QLSKGLLSAPESCYRYLKKKEANTTSSSCKMASINKQRTEKDRNKMY